MEHVYFLPVPYLFHEIYIVTHHCTYIVVFCFWNTRFLPVPYSISAGSCVLRRLDIFAFAQLAKFTISPHLSFRHVFDIVARARFC